MVCLRYGFNKNTFVILVFLIFVNLTLASVKLGIINGICTEKISDNATSNENKTLNSSINVVWVYVDLSEMYLIIRKVDELRKDNVDIVFVNSTNERIIRTIAKLNVTPTLNLDEVDRKEVESLIKQDPLENCRSLLAQAGSNYVKQSTSRTSCSPISFDDNHFDNNGISNMMAAVFNELKWTLTITFYENSTAHLLDTFSENVNRVGILNRLYNIDTLPTVLQLRDVVNDIYDEMAEQRLNVTIICHVICAQRILKEVNGYDMLESNIRRTALRDHSFWFVVTKSSNQGDEIANVSSILDNVFILNLDAVANNQVVTSDPGQTVNRETLLNNLENMTDFVRTNGSQKAIAALKNYTRGVFNVETCSSYTLYTLMWKPDNASYNSSGLIRKFEPVGTVGISGKLHLHSKLHPNEDFGFNKRNLIVTTIWWPPFVERIQKNGKTIGYFGFCQDFLDELAREMNFTYTYTESPDNEWGRILDQNETWSGMIGQLQKREVDLMMAPASIQAGREKVMDFTHPFYYDTSTILMKRPHPDENKLMRLAKPLRWEILLCISVVLPVSAFLLYMIEKLSPHYKMYGKEGQQDFQMSFWYMFGALLTQGGESLPNSQSGRTIISSFWLFSIVMVATYSGNLIAFLTVSIEKAPFNSLEELVDQSDYKWGTLGGTYFETWFAQSPYSTFQEVWAGIQEFNQTDHEVVHADPNIHINKMYKEKYVYIGDKVYMDYRKANRCELVTATEEIPNMQYGVGLPNNSLYTKEFSDKILALHEGGIFQIFKQKHWPRKSICPGSLVAEAKKIELVDVQAAFILIGIGISLSFIILFFEKLTKYITNRCCVLKDEDPCKHIRTVPTLEFELKDQDANGVINNGFIAHAETNGQCKTRNGFTYDTKCL